MERISSQQLSPCVCRAGQHTYQAVKVPTRFTELLLAGAHKKPVCPLTCLMRKVLVLHMKAARRKGDSLQGWQKVKCVPQMQSCHNNTTSSD